VIRELNTPDHAVLVMSGISKNYSGVAALSDVSFDVRPGEVHALLGENGAGKSTLINIASGATKPDGGSIVFDGVAHSTLTPTLAAQLGIATVHQHPAVLNDLTIAENIRVAVPDRFLHAHGDAVTSMRAMLDDVGFAAHLEDRVDSLSIAEKHLLELAKAFVVSPRLIILDEPTAPLGQESVEMLFDRVAAIAASGASVVYITHRLAEVRRIADRVTVLRDGESRGTENIRDVSDEQLLALIVGRQMESTFPPKRTTDGVEEAPALQIHQLSGRGFKNVSLSAHRGEIVGIAGIVGNGQSDLLRALTGLESHSGSVTIADRQFSPKELRVKSAYMPADRHGDGLMMSLAVRENTVFTALERLRRGLFVNKKIETETVQRELSSLAVKAPSLEATVSELSGGNQQKVVMARALLSEPEILIADEPTQGVDVGARLEIYKILREVSDRGVPVVVASSDAKELEGLCDRVLVMSRGEVVTELRGSNVTEQGILTAAMSAHAHARFDDGASESVEPATKARSTPLQRFSQGDYAPVLVLAAVMLGLGAFVWTKNHRYLSEFNINALMFSTAALGFIALGQTAAMLLGGIDLSVGPLAGFLVVLGSFFLNTEKEALAWVFGFALMFAAAAATGATNGALIRFAKFTPVAATLTTYIALQGFSFLLRANPGGNINASVTKAIRTKIGPVPIVFLVFIGIAGVMEFALRRSKWGHRIRAVGSDSESARKVGVKVTKTVVMGYVISSLFVCLGAIVLLAQLGIGDPRQGIGYTLSSVTAVVVGGTSLLGGRGTFFGSVLGAGLVLQVLNGSTILGLTRPWEHFFQGMLILSAALIYSQIRGKRAATA
jgi:ribose transport system ATP-binding protein